MTGQLIRGGGTGLLALIGGAEFDAPCKEFDSQLLAASGGTEVLVIAAAAAFENPGEKVTKADAYFKKLGATVRSLDVYTRRDANDDALVQAAKSARFFYLTDGSPMHLRSVLKDTQLFDVILAAYRKGAVLAAAGAGATVLCDPMIDSRGGAYTVGFGVVENTALFPHHTNAPDHFWDRAVDLLPSDATLVGLGDHAAILRAGDGSWSLAAGSAVTFTVGGKLKTLKKGPITLR